MAVPWSPTLARQVHELVADYAVSDPCAELSRRLLPMAREQDPDALGLVVRANTAQVRYPVVKPRGTRLWWFYHVTVHVDQHCVDALTGASGTPDTLYFETHFDNQPGDLRFDDSDPDLEDPCL